MSGGHFDYGCFRISQFADELGRDIRMNNTPTGDYEYCPNFSDETVAMLQACHAIIDMAGKLAKEVEWLYSGDIGEESFAEYVKPILKMEKE